MATKVALTKTGKIFFTVVAGIFVIILIISGISMFGDKLFDKKKSEPGNEARGGLFSGLFGSKDFVKISLDEWIGWKSLLDANGGLKTRRGSINDGLGINVEYIVSNDATVSSNLLIKGDIKGAGYTINRYAFLANKFDSSGLNTKMVYITNFSNGGDGIISKSSIRGIEDLQGKKVAIPRFSEAQTLVEWLLNASDLSTSVKEGIRKSYVFFETPDDCAKAFFAGDVDAAATWEPYLTQAKETANARILFSTRQATNLILDGLVFRSDFLEQNGEFVKKLIDGALQASTMYTTEFTSIRELPLFAIESNQSIVEMADGAALATWSDNTRLFSGEAQRMFSDMSGIWLSVGERANPDPGYADKRFSISYVKELESSYRGNEAKPASVFTPKVREVVAEKPNDEALLKKSLIINFGTDSAVIHADSYKELNDFANIAKSLNRVVIQIEGNTDSVGNPEYNKVLSLQRAQSIALYLQAQDIDKDRFIIIGNGISNPIASNNTVEGRAANRRTDIFFKPID